MSSKNSFGESIVSLQAIQSVQQYLAKFAATDDFEGTIESIFGTEIGAAAIRQQWLSGDFSLIPEIRVVSNGALGTANGAYAADLDEILVAADFLARHQADPAAIAGLLLEEIGHKIDRVLNGSVDTPGDEGAIFRSLVSRESLSPEILAGLRTENDSATILVDGNLVSIEKADAEPYLVADINKNSYGSNPRNFYSVGGFLYLIADNDTSGTELWQVNQSTGVATVVEINPGNAGSNPSNLIGAGNTLYFQAYNPTNGYELWKIVNGGTPTVVDLYVGSGSSSPTNFVNIGGTTYFLASGYNGTTSTGQEIWRIDPATGIPTVIEIVTGGGTASPTNLTNVNGTLYFTAYYSDNGVTYTGLELWRLNAAGTPVFLKDIYADSNGSNPGNLTYSNGKLYFTADNFTEGTELWETDGTTAGTKLTSDINTNTYGSSPTNFISVGSTLYFIANNDVSGAELWKADTAGNVSIVELAAGDGGINPENGSANINNLTNVNGTLYFQAYNPTNGYELWKIGTSGTLSQISLYAGAGSSSPSNLINVGGTLYFTASGYDGVNSSTITGNELWRIDPTTGNPVVITISAGSGSSIPSNLTSIGGNLYFQAYTDATGSELWKVNPDDNLPVLVSDLYAGTSGSSPDSIISAGGVIYFIASNATSGRELFRITGTAAPELLDLRITGGSNPTNLITVGDTLYFLADNGINGQELWKANPTGAPVQLEIYSGANGASVNYLTNVNGTLYFEANDPTNGSELWKIGTDGNPARIDLGNGGSSPDLLTNINGTLYFRATYSYDSSNNLLGIYQLGKIDSSGAPAIVQVGAVGNYAYVDNFTLVGSTLFFSAQDGTNGRELWKLDTTGNAVLVKDIQTGNGSSSPSNFYNFGGTLYFTADDGTKGVELWKSDGTAAGTVLAKDINGRTLPSNPTNLINVGNTLYFLADNGINGQELWKVDSTTGLPVQLEIYSGANGASVNYLTNVNGTLYFEANDPTNGSELWKIGTDGNPARIDLGNGGSSPDLLTNINGTLYFRATYSYDSSNNLLGIYQLGKIDSSGAPAIVQVGAVGNYAYVDNFTLVGSTLFFSAQDGTNGRELWKLDTTGNAVLVKDIQTGNGSSSPSNFYNVNETLYFTASDSTSGTELWKSDGTANGTTKLEINAGATGTSIANMVSVAGTLYFTAQNATNGQELWRINATGNPEVLDINAGAGGSNPSNLTNVNGTLYLQAYDPTNGYELWKVAGATATPTLINLYNGGGSSSPSNLLNINGTLYFIASGYNGTTYTGQEIWKIDPATGTPSVIEIVTGSGSGNPTNLTNVNGNLYFTNYYSDNGATYTGNELWKLDAVTGNPVFLKDINVGSAGSDPGSLTFSNGKLYFSADNLTEGRELWAYDISSISTVGNVPKTGTEDQSISFAASDFASVFTSSNGGSLASIRVVALPSNGTLKLNNVNVAANQEISAANLASLTFVPNANFNGNAAFTWNGSDGTTYATSPATVSMSIAAVNDAPELVSAIPDVSLTANNIANFSISGTAFRDVDLDNLTYSATLADDSALPSWLAFNGTSFSGTPPIASIGQNIEIKVIAKDPSNATATDNFILNVLSSNPTNIGLSNSTIAENSANDVQVGVLTSLDPSTTDTFTYTLLNDADGRFKIDGDRLLVADTSLLDYETTTQHTIRVKTTDSTGLTYDRDVTVFVSNVNDANAGTLSFTAPTYSINENGTTVAAVTVQRTNGSEGFVRANIALSNGTATYPGDYTAVSVPVDFANGETSKTVTIPIVDDILTEASETINLTLTSPQGGAILGSQTTAVLTIVDDDEFVAGILAFASNSYTVNENGVPSVTILRTGGSNGAIAVNIVPTNGTAISPGDYNTAPIAVSFANGETSKTFALTGLINDDTVYEQTENLTLTLSTPTGGAVLGTQATANLNISDNDAAPGVVQFSTATYSVNEDGTPVTAITLTRTGGTDGAIGVVVSLSNETATAPADYSSNSIAVNFANGESSKTIIVPIENDTLVEVNETVNLTLTNPTAGATLGTQTSAVLTIVDNDVISLPAGVLSFANSTYSLNESGVPVPTVTIDRTGGSNGAISTTILLNGGTATADSDYTSTPIVVNFANGETTKTVTIPVANDTSIEPTETFNLTLSNPTGGVTIDSTKNTAIVSILDDDVQLSFSGASYSVNENGTAISNITVTRSGRSTGAVSATLSFTDGTAKGCVCAASSVNNDFYNGTFVIDFADGETSKVIPVQLASSGGTNSIRIRDDGKVEGDEFFTISLINPTGGATIGSQGSANVTIIDNDPLPVLSVSFSQNAIAENAGVNAATGTVTRNVATDAPLIITLASSDTTEAKVPQQVTIAAGQTSATFSIDAVDDTILDGTQNVTITATPLNGDTSTPLTGSAATATLQVTDSESSSLTLTIDREIVAETGTALATITRNTNTSSDLVVTLASSDTSEATVPTTVTILAGQTSANFTVSGVNDAITDGSQPVTITAAVSGFTSGVKAISVTDIDVPDLVITQLNPAVPTYTSKQSTFSYKLENKGIIAATAPDKVNTTPVAKDPWIDRVYLSTDNILDSNDKLLGEFPFSASVAPGSFYERNITYFAPKTPGQYYLIGVTDATNKINEGIGESNNTVITPITVTPAYKATVSTDVTIANVGTNVVLRGQANSTQDNSPIAFEFVKIKVENKGIIRELDAFTDASGNFVKQFNPLPGEGGTYNLNAYFPGNPGEDTIPEDSFKLLGMRFEQNDQRLTAVNQKVSQGTTFNGSVKLQNLSDEALSGLTASIVGAPSNWTVNINPAKTMLAGDEEIAVNYTIDVPDNSIRNDIFQLKLTTAQGVSADLPITIDVVPIVPKLVASTTLIKSGMLRGNQNFVEVEITNEGGDTAKNIKVVLPDAPWLSLTSPTIIPSLAPGASTKVTLRLSPDATLPLTEYNGNIFLDVEGNDGDLSLPFNFRAVSTAVGDVKIDISDELTYFAEGAPKLAGAKVRILDYFTKEQIGTAISDATGIVNFASIKEGAYELEVTAENHDTFKQTIQLDAGEFENVNAFLSRQAVRYIWTVTPTEIQDKYTLSIESVFETDVPIPTIVINPPLIDLDDLQVVGQVKQLEMTVTNQGLIAANDINLNIGTHPFYKIEPLIGNVDTLGAKSSIKIPVRITRIADFDTLPSNSGELQLASAPQVPCSISFGLDYSYKCAGQDIERAIPLPIVNVEGNCSKASSPVDFYLPPVGRGFSRGGGGGGGGGSITGSAITINHQPSSCDPRTEILKQALASFALRAGGYIPGPAGVFFQGLSIMVDAAKAAKDGPVEGIRKAVEDLSKKGIETGIEGINADDTTKTKFTEKAGKFLQGLGIAQDLYETYQDFSQALSTPSIQSQLSLNTASSTIDGGIESLLSYLDKLSKVLDARQAFFGESVWNNSQKDPKFIDWFSSFLGDTQFGETEPVKISEVERSGLLSMPLPKGITGSNVNKFIDRWNRTIDYWSSGIFDSTDVPTNQSQDFLALDKIQPIQDALDKASQDALSEGYIDIIDGVTKKAKELQESVEGGGGACAKVKLKIGQDAVLTRAAFLGELEIDNGSGSSLTNLSVNLQIKDETGKVVNELFGIDSPILKNITAVNGTGVLTGDDPNTPQDEGVGSAKWTFIPTNLAAPATPTQYTIGGTLAYIENGKAISVPLFSTPITVYPQAELYLDYFHQRDVFADDPFTPQTEVSVPYSLGVLVQNQGKGAAKNLSITSGQPKIVDNEKGLLIDFSIIDSQVNNESATPSLAVNFGNIDAGKTGVATWLFKSSLQGKFTDYKATFEHVNSLGKKELSLIKDVKIHELTRQVKVNHANPDNLADFLVNDTFDANFYPDTIYFSSGGTAPVKTVTTATTDGNASNLDLEVKVNATVDSGWNYIRLADPANGQYQIKKVLRADGSEVNIENIWTTDRTFPGTGRPVYENILNLFDFNATAGNAQYTVLYTTGDNAGPKVREILDVDPNPRTTPVTSLDVVFSEAIESTTFDFNDFALSRDGGANLITNAATVTKINDTTYRIGNLTGITGNIGAYQLSVNASGIKDIEGLAGVGTTTESWLVNGDKPAVASLTGIASDRRNTPVDNVTVTFTEDLNPTSFELSDILLTRNNGANLINADASITQINAKTYQINGLTNLTNIGGDYQILIQAAGVTDTDGNSGVGGKGFSWKLDGANPVVSDIVDLKVDPRNAPVSSLDVILSESIDPTTFTYQDINLTLNGGSNLITNGVTVTSVNDTTYRINGLNAVTTADGNYTLTVNGSGMADTFGNAGIGTQSETWLMDTIAPTTPTNLLVAGTSPSAGKFLINTAKPTISGNLGETGLAVFFYDKTSDNNLGQATVTGTTFTGTVALPANGAQDLEIRVFDAAGNITNTPLNIFADTTKPTITEFVSVPTSSVNPVDTLDVRFSEPLDLTTFTKTDLTLTRDGVALTLPDTVTVEFVSGTTYRIKGLQSLTTPIGSYQIQVDATTIKDNAGNSGDAPKTATFSIVAPPTPGFTLTQTNGDTRITEGGNTDTYSLILKTQPTANVTINLALDNQITTDKNTLTFTPTNWNTAQTVTVTSVDDTTPEGTQAVNITHTVTSTDTTYNALTIPNLTVNITDNDAEIRGLKWNDINGNGIKDSTETGLKDWKIYLDTNTNGQLDTGESSTTTDNSGNYSFTNLRPGTYTVTEEMQSGWKQTYPGVSVTTTASDIQLINPSSPIVTTDTYTTTSATSLVNVNKLWSDVRFKDIKGKGYSTVIIDTGADLNSPYFGADADNNGIADKIVYQYDFADNDTDASDKNNHGSHVASIASTVAPEANLIILKVFKDSGTGSFSDLEKALQWVNTNSTAYKIASVNLSLGDGQNWNTPLSRYGIGDELAAIASQNVIISAAAGNGFYTYNSQVGLAYPAIDPSVISVGAVWTDSFGSRSFSNGAVDNTTAPDRIASFSQRSPLLDVFAPGILITGANATGGSITMGGTSQSTPFVSGIATLAQQIAQTNLGRKLTLAEFDTLLDTKSDLIIDGDDENDNVTNTGATYPRINVLSLAEGILNLSGTSPTTTPTTPTNGGNSTALNLPVTNLNLAHTVTLAAGDVKTDLNFGNQKIERRPKSDFDGDGKSDILWRNDYGSVALWQMDGATVTSRNLTSAPDLDPNWKAADTGDFNGDGKSDILWRNTDGTIAIWAMNGAAVTSSTRTSTPDLDNSWTTAGTGDYNGDGKSDILWRNTDGTIAVWTMDGATVTSSTKTSTPSLASSWKVVGNSDFDEDGKSDILWRNDDGSVALWQMNGAAITAATAVAKVATDWKIAGTGDFNGDRKADILWRNDDGRVVLWQMDGAAITSRSLTSTPARDSSQTVAGINDYNGDGSSDILWRKDTGALEVWQMNGSAVVSSTLTSVAADGSFWKIAAPII